MGFVPGGEIQPWGVSWPRARAVFWGEDHGAPKVDVVLAGVLATQRLHNGQGCSAGQRHLNFSLNLSCSLSIHPQHSFFWDLHAICIKGAAHRQSTRTGWWHLWVPEISRLVLYAKMCFTAAEMVISATFHGLAMNQYKLKICFPKSPNTKNVSQSSDYFTLSCTCTLLKGLEALLSINYKSMVDKLKWVTLLKRFRNGAF